MCACACVCVYACLVHSSPSLCGLLLLLALLLFQRLLFGVRRRGRGWGRGQQWQRVADLCRSLSVRGTAKKRVEQPQGRNKPQP